MSGLTQKIEALAELVGPNIYLQAAIIALAFIFVGKIASWLLSRVVGRISKRSSTDLDDRIIEILHRPVFLAFVLIGLGLAAIRTGMPETPKNITLGILGTLAILIAYNVAQQLVTLFVGVLSRDSDNKLVQSGMLVLMQNIVKIVMIALAIYFVMEAWGIDPTAWLASAGIVGLALSFAAKDTLSNVFAGVSIVADAPYKTGDFIILDSGERGVVTHIGLRSTRLLTRDDVEITIPNGILGNSKIINEAGGPSPKHRSRISVGVAYGSDIDLVIATLETVAADNSDVCKDPAPRVRFRTFGDSSLDFDLMFWIARPADRGRVRHELNYAVYKAFAEANIEIPYPQQDLHVRNMPTQ